MGAAKKSRITIGLFQIPVRLDVAVDSETSNTHTVCTGDGTHEPVRVKAHVDCPTCKASHSSVWGFSERGIEQDGKVVVVTADEIKAAGGQPIKELNLGFSSRREVYASTVAGDSVQNVFPDRGGEKGYTALVTELSNRPDVVAHTVWAPSTKNALWVLEVVDGRLIASKRAWPEDVRAVAAIAPAEVTTIEQTTLSATIDALTGGFDVAAYRDAARDGMAALIASRLGEAVAVSASGPTVVGDMLGALQATLQQIAPATKPKRVRKAAAKKAPSKVPVKKAAARRPAKKTTSAA